jgi:hypothetical protein
MKKKFYNKNAKQTSKIIKIEFTVFENIKLKLSLKTFITVFCSQLLHKYLDEIREISNANLKRGNPWVLKIPTC